MTDQLDLFEIIETEDRDAQARRNVQEGYRIWLKTKYLTPCGPDAVIDYRIHNGIIHLCSKMPEKVYMWQNPTASHNGGQFWCRQEKGTLNGEQMDVCPYCKADLCHGEGLRFLRKSEGRQYFEESYRKYYGLEEVKNDTRRNQEKP